MKLSASSAEIPAGLDLLKQLFPAAGPAVDSIKSGLTGITVSGSLVVSKQISPAERTTIELDLTA